jgi:hypothetical protein
VAFELARDIYREAGMDRWDDWFEARLRSIDDLIASRRSGPKGRQLKPSQAY